jgi:hypothetical protein
MARSCHALATAVAWLRNLASLSAAAAGRSINPPPARSRADASMTGTAGTAGMNLIMFLRRARRPHRSGHTDASRSRRAAIAGSMMDGETGRRNGCGERCICSAGQLRSATMTCEPLP